MLDVDKRVLAQRVDVGEYAARHDASRVIGRRRRKGHALRNPELSIVFVFARIRLGIKRRQGEFQLIVWAPL